ncbi:MAG: ZIP family metal transporter [Candidatus Ventricola sp.]
MRSFVWAACGTGFTFAMTALGAALVFFFTSRIGERMNRLCLGFAAGVMSAASVFSLILPAMEQASGGAAWQVAAVGFAAGAGLMLALDALLCRAQGARLCQGEGRRLTMLFSAVTLHNIPEGMAVGLAFAVAAGDGLAGLAGACALALGIGIQNFPEGAAISLPLRQSGMSRRRSFGFGVLSGAVEPVFGVAAALMARLAAPAMPWLMTFAAGAMMWVVVAEMLPHAAARRDGALAAMVGYMVMMALDMALG